MSGTIEEKSSTTNSDFLHDYLQKTNLSTTASLNQYIKDHQISRDENETDEAFTKRVKKINYLNLAQQLIRHSSQNTPTRQIIKPNQNSLTKPATGIAPLKRMKPVFSPAEDPDFDDEFVLDDINSRDIYDQSSSSSSSSDNDEDIHRIVPYKTNHHHHHTFANDIKQKLSNLAADVVRTFGASNTMGGGDDDLTKPLPVSTSFSSRLFPNRIKETNNQNNNSIQEISTQVDTTTTDTNHDDSETDQENDEDADADLLYTNESLLPQVDWENLEKQLKQAQMERERYDKLIALEKIQSQYKSNPVDTQGCLTS